MNRDDIIRMAREAGGVDITSHGWTSWVGVHSTEFLERFAALIAAEKEQQMIRDGWRQCAKGQRTTQFCGLLDAAVKAEREACAKVCDDTAKDYWELSWADQEEAAVQCATAIRARGKV